MKDARLELRVEEGLLRAIDDARGDVSRTRWVERALETALRQGASSAGGVQVSADRPPSAQSRAPKDYDPHDHAIYGRGEPKPYTPPRPKGGK